MGFAREVALAALIAMPICHQAIAAGAELDGVPVEVIATMPPLRFCNAYGLEQDCSLFLGVQGQAPSLPRRIAVAGSADGTKVYLGFALRATLNMRPGEVDEAVATVNDIGKAIGARLIKVQVFAPKGLISTGSVWVSFDGTLPVGALLSFDRDLYSALKTHPAGLGARSSESGSAAGFAGPASSPTPAEQK